MVLSDCLMVSDTLSASSVNIIIVTDTQLIAEKMKQVESVTYIYQSLNLVYTKLNTIFCKINIIVHFGPSNSLRLFYTR